MRSPHEGSPSPRLHPARQGHHRRRCRHRPGTRRGGARPRGVRHPGLHRRLRRRPAARRCAAAGSSPRPSWRRAYVQYTPDPTGFREYADGIAYLAQKYPRWVSVTTLRTDAHRPQGRHLGGGPEAVRRPRRHRRRPRDPGHQDHRPRGAGRGQGDAAFSLSVHGNERGGLEGGLRAAEDLAIAATTGGTIADGVAGYESTTGQDARRSTATRSRTCWPRRPSTSSTSTPTAGRSATCTPSRRRRDLRAARNSIGTDLNRQMPTVGRIDPSRNPLQESETSAGVQLARAGRRGRARAA